MNPDLKQIDTLYASGLQKNIKAAFDLFEKHNFSLQKIIDYVSEKHTAIKHNKDCPLFIKEKQLCIGPLKFHFYTWEDKEPLDIDTIYVTSLSLSLVDITGKTVWRSNNNIHTEIFEFSFKGFEKQRDFAEQRLKIKQTFWDFFDGIDMNKTDRLYQYIYNSFCNKP